MRQETVFLYEYFIKMQLKCLKRGYHMQMECLITLSPIILWWQRRHAAIASVQTLLARHLREEIALTALAIVMTCKIIAVVVMIVSGRCLLFVCSRCGSTGDDIARHKRHEFNCTDISGVHFLRILILQHSLDDVQPESARRRDTQIVIQGKILVFARSKCNQQLDGRLGYIASFAIEDIWRTPRLG